MATVEERIVSLEQEIASLKRIIARYEADLRDAVSREEKSEIRGLIRISCQNLSDLYRDKARLEGSISGKSFGISSYEMF
jgi:hypothetical protein